MATRWRRLRQISILAVALGAATAWAQPPPGAAVGPPPTLPDVPDTKLEPPAPSHGPYLPVPPDATLVGNVQPAPDADDRTFRSSWSYADAVRFYDRRFAKSGAEIVSRTVDPRAVTFRVRRPDGNIATVIVRDVRPTRIETREPR